MQSSSSYTVMKKYVSGGWRAWACAVANRVHTVRYVPCTGLEGRPAQARCLMPRLLSKFGHVFRCLCQVVLSHSLTLICCTARLLGARSAKGRRCFACSHTQAD